MRKIFLSTAAIIAMTSAPAYAWDRGICSNGWCMYTIDNETSYQDPIHNEIKWVSLTDTSVTPPTTFKFTMELYYGHQTIITIPEKGGCKRNLAIYLHRWPGQMGNGSLSTVFDTTVMADATHAPYQFDVCHMHSIMVSHDHTITYK